MSKRVILVVDDDEVVRLFLARLLENYGYTAECLETAEDAIARLKEGYPPDVILLDLLLPGMRGQELLVFLKEQGMDVPVIILSALSQIKCVVEAMKLGAANYLLKPFDESELELAIEGALEKRKLQNEIRSLRDQLDQYVEYRDILSCNPKMLKIKEIAEQVTDIDVPVLILGESGVGKEVIARFIHSHSRHSGSFVKVNCAALPYDLVESELFGHTRGAFTGALSEKPGKFELAKGGSILLDEMGEMSSYLQAKLLHVLQDGEYYRLGGKCPIRFEGRVLAATNRKLEDAVLKGDFREDLYYRINVIRIEIPPLRERKEDIPLLCDFFLQKYRDKYNSSVERLPRKLVDDFFHYDWPGNVRQLENVIKRYLILPHNDLTLSDLESAHHEFEAVAAKASSLKEISSEAADQAEKTMVLRTLAETHWNRKAAAQRLGICYKALLNKLKKWQVEEPGGYASSPNETPTSRAPQNV
ncbi:MAG: sigma-54-dependent Fis family transcriptional regulator [Acidobacteria bacterium]|nr:sigma-54-dependent Fis family transcriptional regulator [Acidobacteriota bacterium]